METNILFSCNPNAVWKNDGVGAGDATAYLIDFFVNFENPCGVSYNIQT